MLSHRGGGGAAAGGAGHASRQADKGAPRPRDVSAGVFGTWRAPALVRPPGVDLRRLLDVVPTLPGAGALLPRPAPQQQQQERQQQQQQQQALIQQLAPPVAAPAPAAAAAPAKKPLRLSWAGSGIYFWWQLGAMGYLAERYDLTRVEQVGASGGAICAALARCGVPAEAVSESALRLSRAHGIWERPLGLAGAWGPVIEGWLHDTLPADAAERCRGSLGVVVTQLPSCRQVAISDFRDKGDLVNCVMASAHVPVLLDKQLTRSCRGVPCVDGSFPDFFTGENCDHLQCGGDAVVFDYFEDPRIIRNGRMDMLELKRYSEIRRIVLLGRRYAARLEDEGRFEKFDLEPLKVVGAAARRAQEREERRRAAAERRRQEEEGAREAEAEARRRRQLQRRRAEREQAVLAAAAEGGPEGAAAASPAAAAGRAEAGVADLVPRAR